MRHPIHEIWRDTYFDVIEEWRQRYGKGHLEIRKNEKKDTNIFNTVGFCIKKKPMVKSVIYLLFSYQTGYIMWHPRLRIYIYTILFLLEAFWLDVTTSKDECTWTRLTTVVSTRKRPFTEECLFSLLSWVDH
jgi:hypothetical protein